jgi:uncharacterized membrane protein YdfJ with MMPL/SSD domain
LIIMMIITRSLVAAIVIVGTVALSLGASFGLSVLVWQYIFGIQLYWIVLALTPSVAALLGRWFWWPQKVRPRPTSQMLRPYGPRPAVRELLARESRHGS